jgi:hypothetical protein
MSHYQCNNTQKVAFTSPVCVNDPIIQDVRYDDLSPNSLIKLIEDFKWKEARNRLMHNLQEASCWVTKDETENRPGWRRLPIHEICVRQPSQDIVAALLDAYPIGCAEFDSYDRTPLHYAAIHEASSDVIYLLLDAYYDGKDMRDFFDKTPGDYAPHHEAFTKTREEIAVTSRNIRAGIIYLANEGHNDDGRLDFRNPTENKSRVMEALLEEELAQARIESDIAYSERDILIADNVEMKARINGLEQKLKKRQEEIDILSDLGERNRALNQLLGKYEKKNKSLIGAIDAKDGEIINLTNEKKKLKSTISTLTEKLTELTANSSATGDFEQIDNTTSANAVVRKVAEDVNKTDIKAFSSLKAKLSHSEQNRYELQMEVASLTSSQAIATERVKNLEEMVAKLEKGYFEMTDQLVERTRMMHQQSSYKR